MNFTENCIYHIYNRGNNKQLLFFEHDNYFYFLRLIKKFLQPRCHILAWCLMPNHFHFLIYATDYGAQFLQKGCIYSQQISEGIRLLLSSYTKAINKRYGRTGNLFQQKTKSKCMLEGKGNYTLTAFHYIHQNPLKAGLVYRMGDWPYSSFRDYAGYRKGNICNKELTFAVLNFNMSDFVNDDSNYSLKNVDKIF